MTKDENYVEFVVKKIYIYIFNKCYAKLDYMSESILYTTLKTNYTNM